MIFKHNVTLYITYKWDTFKGEKMLFAGSMLLMVTDYLTNAGQLSNLSEFLSRFWTREIDIIT